MIKENISTVEKYTIELKKICIDRSKHITYREEERVNRWFDKKNLPKWIRRLTFGIFRWWRFYHPLKSELLTIEETVRFVKSYMNVVEHCRRYSHDGGNDIQINFFSWRNAAYQTIMEGEVKDLGKPVGFRYNFHGRDTSQWLFGFGLVFNTENREFSLNT